MSISQDWISRGFTAPSSQVRRSLRLRANARSAAMSPRSSSPRAVSRYSVRGGRPSTVARSRMPACSSSVSRVVSVAGGIEPSDCMNSPNRTAPACEAQITDTVQRRSRRSAARRTSSGSGSQLRQRM